MGPAFILGRNRRDQYGRSNTLYLRAIAPHLFGSKGSRPGYFIKILYPSYHSFPRGDGNPHRCALLEDKKGWRFIQPYGKGRKREWRRMMNREPQEIFPKDSRKTYVLMALV